LLDSLLQEILSYVSFKRMNLRVVHDENNKLFFTDIPSSGKGVLQYSPVDGRENLLDFWHTQVPVNCRGKGIGAVLAKAALDWAVQEQRKVILTCSFLQKFHKVNRDPKHQIVVVDYQ